MEESKKDNNNSKILRINFDFILDSNKHPTPEKSCQDIMTIGNLRIEYCIEKKPKSNRSLRIFELADKPINIDELLRR